MPELPEVETVCRDLRERILNLEIARVQIYDEKIWRGKTPPEFLIGKKFCGISRRGKFLVFEIENCSKFLIAHLRMTGQLLFTENSEILAGGHGEKIYFSATRAEIFFKSGAKLCFADPRKFGFFEVLSAEKFQKFSENWGAEPLEKNFTFAKFKKLLRSKKNVKSFLLDQKIIAGVGNIYADEILFAAAISPQKKVGNLNEKSLRAIFSNLKKILKAGIENRGTTFNSFRDARGKIGNFQEFLKVYDRAGKTCPRCGAVLRKIRVASRGTTFCENCQK